MKRLPDEGELLTDKGLRKLVLLAWKDSNMYQRWSWEIFLLERADKSLSTGARQFGEGIPTGRMRGTYRIRTGAALRIAIQKMLGADVFQDVTWSWAALLKKIERFTPKLAAEIRELQLQERQAERKTAAEIARRYELDRPIREWVNQATWPRSNTTGGGGIAGSVANSRLTSGVTAYAKAYLAEHGQLPTGRHDIDQVIGDADAAAICAPQQNGIGRAVSAPGRVKLTVQFSDV